MWPCTGKLENWQWLPNCMPCLQCHPTPISFLVFVLVPPSVVNHSVLCILKVHGKSFCYSTRVIVELLGYSMSLEFKGKTGSEGPDAHSPGSACPLEYTPLWRCCLRAPGSWCAVLVSQQCFWSQKQRARSAHIAWPKQSAFWRMSN